MRESKLKSLYGTGETDVIQLVEDLTKKAGETVTVALLQTLAGSGAEGTATLEGAADVLGNASDSVTVAVLRNAVEQTGAEQFKSEIDMLKAAGPKLKQWYARKDYLKLLEALQSAKVDGKTAYASCTEAEKDAYLALNADRVRFGAAASNNAANDHSACLTTLDSTSDKCTITNVRQGRRWLKACDPLIRPIDTGETGEMFVALAGSECFRDLKTSMDTVHTYAMERGKSNPLFVDGDLLVENIVVKEIPEIARVADVGNGGTDDAQPFFILGAQALLFAWAQRPRPTRSVRDYEFINGVGLEGIRGIKKTMFNSIQHGVFTHWFCANPDA